MNAGLVCKGCSPRDVVVEGHSHLCTARHVLLQVPQHLEIVARSHSRLVQRVHACKEAAKRRDAVALTNAEDTRVDVGGTGLQGNERIGDAAARVVVGVELNACRDSACETAQERV